MKSEDKTIKSQCQVNSQLIFERDTEEDFIFHVYSLSLKNMTEYSLPTVLREIERNE